LNFNPHAANQVDFKNADRAPLLLISGGMNHVAPASTNAENFKKHRKSQAMTEYKEFPERSHYKLGQPGSEGVADFALDWAVQAADAGHPAPIEIRKRRAARPSPRARQRAGRSGGRRALSRVRVLAGARKRSVRAVPSRIGATARTVTVPPPARSTEA
jgi:hypothetical protein